MIEKAANILFLKYRVSDQTSETSAIGAIYIQVLKNGNCDTQGMKNNIFQFSFEVKT